MADTRRPPSSRSSTSIASWRRRRIRARGIELGRRPGRVVPDLRLRRSVGTRAVAGRVVDSARQAGRRGRGVPVGRRPEEDPGHDRRRRPVPGRRRPERAGVPVRVEGGIPLPRPAGRPERPVGRVRPPPPRRAPRGPASIGRPRRSLATRSARSPGALIAEAQKDARRRS